MNTATQDWAIRLDGPGGTDRLQRVDWPPEAPRPGEVRIRHEAMGLNFIDIYHRTGLYPLAPPGIPGVEGAGVVEAVGEGVEALVPGQRVVYAGVPGAYATTRLLPAWRAIARPDAIGADVAASGLLRGLTVHMLLTRIHPVRPGSVLLVHAAAGGLGMLLTRWAKRLGAIVIGTVGSVDKAEIARANGADDVIVGRNADLVAEVARLTGGQGVDFAIDGIGGERLLRTLDCVRPFGTVASVGQAAGPIPPIPVEAIGPRRSLIFARPSVMAYAAERAIYPDAVAAVLAMLDVDATPQHYRLVDAATAQADLEAGRIVGAAILRP